jgi:HEAT repeat protein
MEGLATPHGTEKLLGEFRKDVEEHELVEPSEWYNNDEQLAKALKGMLEAKRQYGQGGRRRTQALACLTQEEVKLCGFEPKAYTREVVEAVNEKLEHSDQAERRAALTTLGKLEPATLAQHSAALVAKLEDKEWEVRQKVVVTLGKMEPAKLAQLSADLVAKLEDERKEVRQTVVATLGKLEPAKLAQLSADLVAKLKDPRKYVRQTVVEMLGKLEPATLAQQHGADLVQMRDRADAGVRETVVQMLKKLGRW